MREIIELTSLDAPEIEMYTSYSETQLLHYYEPDLGVFIAESAKVIERAMAAGYEVISGLMEDLPMSEETKEFIEANPNFPLYRLPHEEFSKMTGYGKPRGVICAMRRKQMPSYKDVIANARRIVVMDNVNNPTNVGSIFRSAAAMGIDAVLMTPGCTDPLYRRSARVSMGTVFQIPWTYLTYYDAWPLTAGEELKKEGFVVAAMALSDRSISLTELSERNPEKLAIVMGNEGLGLDQVTIDMCDETVKIPMTPGVDSLNVAAASAVAFWELSMKSI